MQCFVDSGRMLHLISVKLYSLFVLVLFFFFFGLEVAQQQQLIYRNLFRSCFDSNKQKDERFFYCIPRC